MNRLKVLGERKRINISMAKAVREIANILMRGRPGGGKFSGLLEALVLEEYDRQRYEVDKSIAALMQENLSLKEQLKNARQMNRGERDLTAEYKRLFEEANARLDEGRKVENTIRSGKWANQVNQKHPDTT